MFKKAEEVMKYLEEWFKKMGFEGTVEFWNCYPSKSSRKGRTTWHVEVLLPFSFFFVFDDNGDVEDTHGYFNGGTPQVFDKDGNKVNI